MSPATTDLCDAYPNDLQIVAPIFTDYGGGREFSGLITTVKLFEDNVLLRATLEEPAAGRVLVVDGGASLRCALMGDQMAVLAHQNGWKGIIINGAIRDVNALEKIAVGIKALAACPMKSAKNGCGERDIAVRFAEVIFEPGAWLAADHDGVVVSAAPLE